LYVLSSSVSLKSKYLFSDFLAYCWLR